MNDATPRDVATQFGIAAALSFSAIALPFVPEAILAYAGYRYLRHFTYGWRTWRAPARIPLHLGRRGYRDATTRRRGDAGWPIGTAATGQVWLRRDDLVQGLSFYSDDPAWQADAAANLVFGACLHRMGAIIVQTADTDMLAGPLAEVAKPFGRDVGMVALDFRSAPRPPLRIATSTLASAIADLRLGPEASAVNKALLPVLEHLAARYRKSPLALYRAFTDKTAFKRLIDGKYEIDGMTVSDKEAASPDGAALSAVLETIRNLPNELREAGRQALEVHARELATLTSVSLTEGLDLSAALSAGGLVIIRPASALTAALVVARCVEALASKGPGLAGNCLIHIAYPDALSGASAKRFRTAAVKGGAIGTLAFPVRPANHVHKATRTVSALRIQSREAQGRVVPSTGKIASAIKECPFTLDLHLPEIPKIAASETSENADRR